MAVLGLVDGRILYDSLYNHMHPLNVTYENFYGFLNCTGLSPCSTFMTN
jgi:hypothetical protein